MLQLRLGMRWLSRISLLIGLAAMVLTAYAVGLGHVARHLHAIGWWFALTLGLDVVATGVDSIAIYGLAHRGDGPSFGRVLVAQMAGRAVNSVTPGGALGEAVKANVLSESTSVNRAIAAVVYCSLVSLIVSLGVVAVGAPLTGAFLTRLPGELRWGLIVAGALAAAAAVGLAVLVRRGMLSSVVDVGVRLHVVAVKRRKKWAKRLLDIDQRLHGTRGSKARHLAVGCGIVSKAIGFLSVWVILHAAGYDISAGMLAAIVSTGVVLGWMSALVPMGLGVAETGNYALFSALSAPPTVGVSLALARRVNQVAFAAVGFSVLGLWRLGLKTVPRVRRRLTGSIAALRRGR